ncbi:hypothetical protein LF1_39240 [Rubripirellula obstinata]|uniref:Uncharacterized protein n=1 Tax=Rubripirellula obstinata TaxID=406547 RepID=A0A5B1CJM1_9BACT|nr:hypothetical protein [Rubripirellula obstinata]KAA1261377.1 hypothetical protein LF1_39240 [Rubripirellula obstinata]
MTKIVATIRDLIAAWYYTDRIRVSPTTGRLLALQVGDRFVIRGESYEVLRREVDDTTNGTVLTYQLDGSQGGSQGGSQRRSILTVQQDGNDGNSVGQLITSGKHDPRSMSVFNDDIALMPGGLPNAVKSFGPGKHALGTYEFL